MPVCKNCARTAATAEMRRSTRPGEWLCKDKEPCKQRRIANRANEIAFKKGAK